MQSLHNYSQYMYEPARNFPGDETHWAQLNDATLASIFCEKTIAIICPRMSIEDAKNIRPKVDDAYHHMVHFFFPDGDRIVSFLYESYFFSFFRHCFKEL